LVVGDDTIQVIISDFHTSFEGRKYIDFGAFAAFGSIEIARHFT